MVLSNLDTIVRRWLLEKGLPIHYYMEALFHASTALRELSFDTLKIINVANLPVNNYAAIDLPSDYKDDIAVCVNYGGVLSELPKQKWINPIRLHDATTGSFELSSTNIANNLQGVFFGQSNNYWSWFWNISDYGESTGRFFGAKGGTSQGYKVVLERRQIQLTENFADSNVVLLYISDGQSADNATQIDSYAISCIQAYIDWKRSPNSALKDSGEARTFYNEKRLLRARLDDMTLVDIKNVLHNSYKATNKN